MTTSTHEPPRATTSSAKVAHAERIPTISLAGLHGDDADERAAFIAAVGRAAEVYGFFLLTDHGLPASVRQGGFDAGRAFFELPEPDKRRFMETFSNRGYQPMFDNLRGDGRPSAQEGYTMGHPATPSDASLLAIPFYAPTPWPDLPAFRERFEALYWAMFGLGRDLLGAMALHLGARDDFFDAALTDTYAHLRINHYPPHETIAHLADEGVFAHRDESLLTLLLQDRNGGLQVMGRDDAWIPVEPNPDAVVVNVGKMLRHWTGGRYNAALHKVVNVSGRDRYSIPLFMHPSFRTVIDPRALSGQDDPDYLPVVAGEKVFSSFAATRQSWKDAGKAAATVA